MCRDVPIRGHCGWSVIIAGAVLASAGCSGSARAPQGSRSSAMSGDVQDAFLQWPLPQGAEQYADIGVAMAVMCLALWAWAAQTLVARGFYAMGNTWLPPLLGTAVMVIAYPMYTALGQAAGTTGLATASATAVCTYVALLYGLLKRQFPGCTDPFIGFLARMVVATSVGIAAGLGIEGHISLAPLAQGRVLVMVGSTAFVAAVWLLRVPEALELASTVRRRVAARLHKP